MVTQVPDGAGDHRERVQPGTGDPAEEAGGAAEQPVRQAHEHGEAVREPAGRHGGRLCEAHRGAEVRFYPRIEGQHSYTQIKIQTETDIQNLEKCFEEVKALY